jgi:hypothetical protein
MMSDDEDVAVLLLALKDAGGLVTVGGKQFVDKRVLREVLHTYCEALCDRMRTKLAPAVAADPETQDRLTAEIDRIERQIAAVIGEVMPVAN